MAKSALITGISGQDGSYLAELLLKKDYRVFGLIPHEEPMDATNLSGIKDQVSLLKGDVCQSDSLKSVIDKAEPDEIYNLAAQSFVPLSWEKPVETADISALGPVRILELMKASYDKIRLFQATTSEIFGNATESPQNELTPINPRNPYGASKAFAHTLIRNMREEHGLFAVSGILFNHESPRRSPRFVTRKITQTVAQIKAGKKTQIELGKLDSARDWGFAGDYVEAMWKMLQADQADDFIIATGELHTVNDWVNIAFSHVGLKPEDHVKTDKKLFRSEKKTSIVGDISKIKKKLSWEPKTSFETLVNMMLDVDLKEAGIKLDTSLR